jgi:hypothetical protein
LQRGEAAIPRVSREKVEQPGNAGSINRRRHGDAFAVRREEATPS